MPSYKSFPCYIFRKNITDVARLNGCTITFQHLLHTKMSAEQEPKIGEEIGRFKLLALLGRGASGDVYKARDTLMDREVALKILHTNELADPIARARFEREGVIVSSLSHENIVQFFAVGISKSAYPYIAMELLEGKTLREVLSSEGSLGIERALNIASKISEAINYAFEKGIIHRDIKPENIILLDSGFGETAKLLDFGLAKNLTTNLDNATLTKTGHLIGSAAYMAPELGKGEKPDHRTDLYALTCVLYECIAGSQPYKGETPPAVLFQHANEPIPSLAKRSNEYVPTELEYVIKKGLAKDAAQRFQTADELTTALQNARTALTKNNSGRKVLMPLTALIIMALAALAITTLASKNERNTKSAETKPSDEKTVGSLKVRGLIKMALSDTPVDSEAESIDQALKQELSRVDRGLLLRLKAKTTKNTSAKLYFNIRAFQYMASDEANAPIYCELECLRSAIQGCGNMGLLNAQSRYLYRYITKLSEWLKDGKKIPLKYQSATQTPDRSNLQSAKLEQILVFLTRGETDKARAKFSQMEKGLEYAPAMFVARIRWRLGEKKQVEDSIYDELSSADYLSTLADFFRVKGLNEWSARCSAQAIEKTQENVTEEVFQSGIFSYIALSKFADAINSIKQRIAIDSHEIRSNWHEYTKRRSFRIAALEYCGDPDAAKRVLKSYLASKISEKDDKVILSQFDDLLSKAPLNPEEQMRYFLKESLRSSIPMVQWFAMSKAKNVAKTFAVSKDDKLDLWLTEQVIIHQFLLSTRELELCQEILKETKDALKNSLKASKIREAAQIRLAELYYLMEDSAKCIKELEKMEGRKDEAFACARVYNLELLLNRPQKAAEMINRCSDFKELLQMSRLSIPSSERVLAEKCLSKAKLMLGKSVLRQTEFYTEQALAYLEFNQANKANDTISMIDPKNIQSHADKFTMTSISDAALACLLADRREQGDKIMNIRPKLDELN